MFSRLRRHPLSAIVVLSIVLRVAVLARGGRVFDDPDNYLPMARSLASGEGFALGGRLTAYRPPLYPLLLVPAVELVPWAYWGIGALHLGLGAGTVAMTAAAATRFGLSRRRAMVAAMVVACDPVLLWQSRSVMTETPAAFLVAAMLAGLSLGGRRGAIFGGIASGLAGLCRPSLLAISTLTIAAGLVAPLGRWRERLTRSTILAATTTIVLLPWMLRNLVAIGEPIWTTTHGGYTLALANNEVYYRDILDGPPGRVWTGDDQWHWWDSVNRETAGLTEPEADRFVRNQVLALARRQPLDFVRASIARLGRFWAVAPSEAVYPRPARVATMIWTIPLWTALALGVLRRPAWSWPTIAATMAVFGLTIVHLAFWTDLRMRAPIVPAIAILAAGAGTRSNEDGRGRDQVGLGSLGSG